MLKTSESETGIARTSPWYHGGTDEKIIAVPTLKLTQHYEHVRAYTDLPRIALEQIQHFFEHYKDLEPGKWVKVLRWGGADDAHRLIAEGMARAKAKK